MSSQSKEIQLTLRLDETLYKKFKEKILDGGYSYSGVLRLLVKQWISGEVGKNGKHKS